VFPVSEQQEQRLVPSKSGVASVAALDLSLHFALLLTCFRADTVLAIVRMTRMAIAVAYSSNSALEEIREFCSGET